MPSFDIVSEYDLHEVNNAIDQTVREVGTRYDFKDANAKIELKDESVHLSAQSDFQLQQILDILKAKMAKRQVDLQILDIKPPVIALNKATQEVKLKKGIDKELAKKVVQIIKNSKAKVQAAIQGEQVRVTGKNRDDLQEVIALMRSQDVGMPLQFNNFRD
jgi:cyclic-di-GMP-binding protein